MLWTKTYGGHGASYANAITGMKDGNFMVAGAITSASTRKQDVYLLKINLQGDTLWTRTMGDTGDNAGKAVVQLPDGALLVACNWLISIDSTVGLVNLSSAGEVVWEKHYPGNSPGGLALTSDSCCIAACGQGLSRLLKIKWNGDLVWSNYYSNIGDMGKWGACAITTLSDKNIVIGGWTYWSGVHGFWDMLLKVNSNGDALWQGSYCSRICIAPPFLCDGRILAAIPSADGNCLVAGQVNGSAFFQKITSAGEFIWDESLSKYTGGVANCISVSDNGIILAAGTELQGAGTTKLVLYSLIDDKYAYNSVPFSFKIPVSGDSLAFTYRPGNMPAGMTVSNGGTIKYSPTTSISSLEHIELFVANSTGSGDSLTFNLYVNSKDNPIAVIRAPNGKAHATSQNHEIMVTQINSMVQFSAGLESGALGIYDVRGRCLARVPVVNGIARWTGFDAAGNKSSTGTYFVRYFGSNKAGNIKAVSLLLMSQ
jgi:hypothetical protein